MRKVFQKAIDLLDAGTGCVLATVVDTVGSTPRKTGAQMVVGPEGIEAGTVGGGLVEFRAVQTARDLLASRSSMVRGVSHETAAAVREGTACGGATGLLFTYMPAGDASWPALLREAVGMMERGEHGTLVFPLPAEEAGREAFDGSAVLRRSSGALAAHAGAQTPLNDSVQIKLQVPSRVVIFGGGHVSQALAPVLDGVGFAVTVFEEREALADGRLFPKACSIVLGDYSDIAASVRLAPEDFAVVMTHGHEQDFQVVGQLIGRPLAYVGMMGSKRKVASARAWLEAAGADVAAFDRVHAPIGLDILAQTPAEIAVSIAAELIRDRASLQ